MGGRGVGVRGLDVAVGVGGRGVGVAALKVAVAVGGTGVGDGVSVTTGTGVSVGTCATVAVNVCTGVGVLVGVAVIDGLGVLVGVGVTVGEGAMRESKGQLKPRPVVIATNIIPMMAKDCRFKSLILFLYAYWLGKSVALEARACRRHSPADRQVHTRHALLVVNEGGIGELPGLAAIDHSYAYPDYSPQSWHLPTTEHTRRRCSRTVRRPHRW